MNVPQYTSSHAADPIAIRLQTWVNDELRQDSDLSDLVFDVAELISYLSSIMTLLPGDLICTGSPAGVGAFQDPPAYLGVGDIVRTEITGLGGTRNGIVADQHAAAELQPASGRTREPSRPATRS